MVRIDKKQVIGDEIIIPYYLFFKLNFYLVGLENKPKPFTTQ